MMEMGGNTILTIGADKKYTQHAYFKIPTAQTAQENCVSHNGGLIPVPGRDLMVQGWYQGGVDVMDFTDADHPFEIAYFDRGSIDPPPPTADPTRPPPGAEAVGGRARGTIGGSWGAYYWNGMIYSSELDRGFDILELTPSDQLSANEIAAAKLVTLRASTIRRASRRSCGRRRSRWCGRISTSSCAATDSRPRARRRSRPRSTRRRKRAVRRAGRR